VADQPIAIRDIDLRQIKQPVAHHLPTDSCKADTELAAVVAAWPELPQAIRTGILAIVRAAVEKA
jgi:hypothetical protein